MKLEERTFGTPCHSLSPLGAWNNYLGAASQKLLTKIRISLSEGSCFIQNNIFIWALSPYITCVENLAFRKPTRQSGNGSCGGSSEKAVDGNVGTNFGPGAQCAHTGVDDPSWWWVDLGSDNVPISEVLLVNRFSPHEFIRQRNKDFELTLGQ